MASKCVQNIGRKCYFGGETTDFTNKIIYCNKKDSWLSPIRACFAIRQLHVGPKTKQLPAASTAFDEHKQEPAEKLHKRLETSKLNKNYFSNIGLYSTRHC